MNRSFNKKIKSEKKLAKGGEFLALIKGVALSYCITCIIFIIYALILTYTDVSESYVSLVALFSTTISCIIGAYKTGNNLENNGLVWGVLTSLLYVVILMLINRLSGVRSDSLLPRISMLVCALCGGGVGGILGINKK